MNKTSARTCFGCKATCPKGCSFGFEIRKLRVGAGTTERVFRFPRNPCFKSVTQKRFMEISEYLDAKVA